MGSGTPRSPRPEAGFPPPPAPSLVLYTRSGPLRLDRVVLVGILNVTPDSFSDGGRWAEPGDAAAHARELVAAGAGMLDLGAESTRPGAAPVAARDELRRLLPVLRAVRAAVTVPLSVDTMKGAVARAALAEGADVVNDVSAGRFDADMLPLCAAAGAPVILMHMRGTPATMQRDPVYADVVQEVVGFLTGRVAAAQAAGVPPAAIVLDPGIGFGKTVAHNCQLLRRLDALTALGYPVLVGPSRKGFIGELTDRAEPADRLLGTAAAVAVAVAAGARLVRVHDVAAMREVVAVAEAVARA